MSVEGRAPLHEWLRLNAERDIQAAVRRAVVDDECEPREFYEVAGRALELTFMAVLASLNPQLILDPRVKLPARLELERSELTWDDMALRMRTLPMGELLTHIGHLVPEVGAMAKSDTGPLKSLVSHRNAVQHLGDCSGSSMSEHVVVLIEALSFCYERQGWSLSDAMTFELFEIAMSVKHGARDEAFARSRIALDRARRRLEDRLTDTPVDVLDVMADKWTAERLRDYDDFAPALCPVCERPAVVEGWIEFTEEYEPDGPHHIGGFTVRASVSAASFKCIVCGLHLEDDEITASHIDFEREYELEGDAYDDYMQGLHDAWAEDHYRDR